MNIELARAGQADIRTLALTEQEGQNLTHAPIASEQEWEEMLRTQVVHVILIDGEVAGTLLYRHREPGRLHITGIDMRRQYQGLATGRKVLEKMILQHPETKRFDIVIEADNQPALNLYKSLGFKNEARIAEFGEEPKLLLSMHR